METVKGICYVENVFLGLLHKFITYNDEVRQ